MSHVLLAQQLASSAQDSMTSGTVHDTRAVKKAPRWAVVVFLTLLIKMLVRNNLARCVRTEGVGEWALLFGIEGRDDACSNDM